MDDPDASDWLWRWSWESMCGPDGMQVWSPIHGDLGLCFQLLGLQVRFIILIPSFPRLHIGANFEDPLPNQKIIVGRWKIINLCFIFLGACVGIPGFDVSFFLRSARPLDSERTHNPKMAAMSSRNFSSSCSCSSFEGVHRDCHFPAWSAPCSVLIFRSRSSYLGCTFRLRSCSKVIT